MPKNIFDWSHTMVYLSGAMEFASDRGQGWRDELIPKLMAIGVPADRILNPCRKPKSVTHNISDRHEQVLIREARSHGDWDALDETMKAIAHFDLRMVDKSDFVIAVMPEHPAINLLADVRSKAGDKLNGTIDKIAGSLASLRVPTYGTLHEIVVARQQRKPVLLVWPPDGMKSCSAWLAWLVGHKNVFSSMDECVAKLDGIMRGTESLEDDEDWLVFALVNRCHHQGGGS